jgi:reactive chlorine resistance protein C
MLKSKMATQGDESGGDARLVLGVFDDARTRRLGAIGRGVLRYGLVALLLLWGNFKFFEFEAQAIRPLLEHHPLMSWMVPAFGVRGASALVGVVELVAALLMCTRSFRPQLSALGSLIAAGTFAVTVSFLFTTPGALSLQSEIGGFLMKDVILLGAALYTAAEALEAAARRSQTR